MTCTPPGWPPATAPDAADAGVIRPRRPGRPDRRADRRRLPGGRSDGARRRDRAGRARLRRRSCPRAGASRPAPGRYRLRRRGDAAVFGALGRAAVLEAVPAPAAAAAVVRRTATAFTAGPPRSRPALRVPRRARLRPGRDRAPWPGAGRAARTATARSPGAGPGCSSSRPAAPSRAASASAPRWAPARSPGPATTSRSPSGSTTSGHRFVVEVGTDEGARILAEVTAPRRRRGERGARRGPRSDAAEQRMGRADARRRPARAAARQPRSPRAGTTSPTAA